MAPPSDIVVVGAGIIGCAVAYELACRGASVEVIDDRPAGMGATHAAAGVLAPFIEADAGGPLLDLASRSLELFDAFVARVESDAGFSLNYQRSGTLDVAFEAESMRRYAATEAFMRARGMAAELLDGPSLRSCEPAVSDAALGGLLIPSHGFVGASDLTRALAAGARRHGARLIEHRRVHRISSSGDDLVVDTDRGSLTAGAVVLAAGSWAGQIVVEGAADRIPVKPIRGQLLQLAWTAPLLRRVLWGERCYMVPWQDGSVLVGATVEDVGFAEQTTVTGVRDLLAAACEMVPATMTAGFVTARAGLRPGTPDHLPVIGWSHALPNLMYATGHYRNGILLAPLTAKLVADAVLGNFIDPILACTRPERFGNV